MATARRLQVAAAVLIVSLLFVGSESQTESESELPIESEPQVALPMPLLSAQKAVLPSPSPPPPTDSPYGTNKAGVPGACPLSPAGQNNDNGNGKCTATDVIDVYNDKEYPFCQNCTCPELTGMCFNDSCSDTTGKFGRWRVSELHKSIPESGLS